MTLQTVTAAQIQGLMEALTPDQKGRFQSVLSAVALQAEVVSDLLWKLEIDAGSDILQRQVMGAAITQLAAKLNNPVIQGPTIDELSKAIKDMQSAIQSATDANGVFTQILGFALKIAPLAL